MSGGRVSYSRSIRDGRLVKITELGKSSPPGPTRRSSSGPSGLPRAGQRPSPRPAVSVAGRGGGPWRSLREQVAAHVVAVAKREGTTAAEVLRRDRDLANAYLHPCSQLPPADALAELGKHGGTNMMKSLRAHGLAR